MGLLPSFPIILPWLPWQHSGMDGSSTRFMALAPWLSGWLLLALLFAGTAIKLTHVCLRPSKTACRVFTAFLRTNTMPTGLTSKCWLGRRVALAKVYGRQAIVALSTA